MTITLDDLEADIWRFAAVESTPETMNDLRAKITAFRDGSELVPQYQAPDRATAPVTPPAVPEPAEAEAKQPESLHPPHPEDFLKKCSRCHRHKIASYIPERTHFSRDRGTKDGFRYNCKTCESLRRRQLNGRPAAA